MAHWAERYVGRPFVAGEHDCGHLVLDVQAEQFGREIAGLPSHASGLRAQAAQIEGLARDLGVRTISPGEGDCVLMRRIGVRTSGHHVGIWVDIGEPAVLHCAPGIGTCLHPIRTLRAHDYELVGVYTWR